MRLFMCHTVPILQDIIIIMTDAHTVHHNNAPFTLDWTHAHIRKAYQASAQNKRSVPSMMSAAKRNGCSACDDVCQIESACQLGSAA